MSIAFAAVGSACTSAGTAICAWLIGILPLAYALTGMPYIDRNARSVMSAIWKAGAKEHRDVTGGEFIAQLDHEIANRALRDLIFSLREDGLITLSMPGSHDVADISLLRLTSAGRELVGSWPECGEGPLQPEQEQLLVELIEAARSLPRPEQQWHLGGEEDAPDAMTGPWGERRVLVSDVRALVEQGLLETVHANYVYGDDYVIAAAGHQYYAALKSRSSEPVERQQSELRSFIESDLLRARCPLAYRRWSEAEALLWSADSASELSTIGHKVREATHEFAIALVAEHRPPDVDPDPTKVKNRIADVIFLERDQLGDTRTAFLTALFEYWKRSVDLIQRQEHGRDLLWSDARRVVFHTAVLMYEITTTLDELRLAAPAGAEQI